MKYDLNNAEVSSETTVVTDIHLTFMKRWLKKHSYDIKKVKL